MFFEYGCDRTLFDGLEIAKDQEACDKYMGKFPVISVSMKAVAGDDFEEAREMLETFCRAFQENDVPAIEECFNAYLKKTISIRDIESFYHGILLGLFGYMNDWTVRSNAESGEGYSDIMIENESLGTGIVIELKYAENAAFDAACREALQQIRDRKYVDTLVQDGIGTIYCYGISCYKKRCKVVGEKR